MAAKKKKAPAKPKKSTGSSNLVPLYILIIMGLATALVMVLNSRSGSIAVKDSKDKPSAAADKPGTAKLEGQSSADGDKTADAGEKKKVKLYYLVYSDRTGKISPGSVIREVTGADPLAAALGELVKGLSPSEEKKGLITAMPEGLKVRSVAVKNGIAEIDMSSEFAENAQGDFITGRLNQLFYTAIQFPGVKGISVRMNGKPFSTIGGDGLLLSWPMKKAL
jgi:spore germination protein GerM